MSDQKNTQLLGAAGAGVSAGILSGLLGGAGGMLLVPGLQKLAGIQPSQLFPTAVAVMLPIVASALALQAIHDPLPIREAIPYLIGGALGGWIAGKWGRKLPVRWLHRCFGALMLWGGIRVLWN